MQESVCRLIVIEPPASMHLEYSRKSEILFYAIRFSQQTFKFDRLFIPDHSDALH
jgi:hypothetical protein